jgi:glutaminase
LLDTVLLLLVSTLAAARGPLGARDSDYQMAVTQAYQRYQSESAGKIAEPIVALSAVPAHYAVVVVRVDGKIWEQGDVRVPFVLAAMSAPFTAALVAEQRGPEALNSTLGAVAGTAPVPPARTVADWGSAPNAALGPEGSLAMLSLVQPQHDADGKWHALLQNFNQFAGAELSVNGPAYHGTVPLAPRVPQITRDLGSDGRLSDDAELVADLYLRQNSVAVTAHDLAIMAATLANDGVNPVNGKTAVSPAVAHSIQAQLKSGRKGSSAWMSKAGILASAGISGGIFVVVPGRLGIAVYAPPLDGSGVSLRGQKGIQYLSRALMFP